MNSVDVFRRIVDILDSVEIPYMLTGSFASSYHGSPRATQDIDLVVAPTAGQLRVLAEKLPATEFYFDLDTALDALKRESLFNILDTSSGWKIDCIIRKSREFSRVEFERRGTVEFEGVQLSVAAAEDVVISKLEWAKSGQSKRQLEDAATVIRIRWEDLDHEYLEHWVGELELDTQWQEACRMAGREV